MSNRRKFFGLLASLPALLIPSQPATGKLKVNLELEPIDTKAIVKMIRENRQGITEEIIQQVELRGYAMGPLKGEWKENKWQSM